MLLLPFQITCSELLLMKPHIGRTDLQSKNEKSRQKKKKSRGLRGHGAARGHAQTGQEHHSASALTPKSQTCIHQIISSSFHISPCLSACNLASTRLITYIQRQRQRSLLHRAPLWTHHPFIPAFIPRSQGKEEQRQFQEAAAKRKPESTKTHKLTHGRILLLPPLPPCTPRIVSRSMSRPSGGDDESTTPSAGSPAVVVAAPRGGEEGRRAGEADVAGREGRLRRRLVAEGVAEGRLPAAGEVEDGPVQERQQALHGRTAPLPLPLPPSAHQAKSSKGASQLQLLLLSLFV